MKMKWLIASDIHGSAYYCEELLRVFHEEQADRMLLLGDILYHGPRNRLPDGYDPGRVIALLNEMKNDILCVRGNCDTEVDQMVLDFPIMAEYAILAEGKQMIFATHGHKWNEKNLPALRAGDILLHGHTHIPVCKEEKGVIVMNPGSLTLPKEKSHHGYMTLEKGTFLWKDLNGNLLNRYQMK